MSRRSLLIVVVCAASVAATLLGYRSIRRPAQPRFAQSTSSGQVVSNCVDFHQAASRVGQNGCIAGEVLRAYTSKAGNTFLDFCQDYRSCPFTSVIFSSDRAKFGDLSGLEGRVVEISGYVKTYAGRAEIVVQNPQQIRVPR